MSKSVIPVQDDTVSLNVKWSKISANLAEIGINDESILEASLVPTCSENIVTECPVLVVGFEALKEIWPTVNGGFATNQSTHPTYTSEHKKTVVSGSGYPLMVGMLCASMLIEPVKSSEKAGVPVTT
jgi:hypothetical protein